MAGLAGQWPGYASWRLSQGQYDDIGWAEFVLRCHERVDRLVSFLNWVFDRDHALRDEHEAAVNETRKHVE